MGLTASLSGAPLLPQRGPDQGTALLLWVSGLGAAGTRTCQLPCWRVLILDLSRGLIREVVPVSKALVGSGAVCWLLLVPCAPWQALARVYLVKDRDTGSSKGSELMRLSAQACLTPVSTLV